MADDAGTDPLPASDTAAALAAAVEGDLEPFEELLRVLRPDLLRLAALLHDQGDSREALELCLSTASSNRDCRRATLAARILASLVCEACGESTMESRTRRFAGKTLCQPCFDRVEQKI